MIGLYLLEGDPYASERQRHKLIQTLSIDPAAVRIHHGWDLDLSRFLEEAKTFPFLAERQCLVLKGAEQIAKSSKETIPAALTPLPAFTVLILEAPELSESDPLRRWVQEAGKVLRSEPSNRESAQGMVRQTLAQSAKTIAPDALEILMERCQAETGALAESLDKLILNSGARAEITSEAVLALAERGGDYERFDLVNAFIGSQAGRCLKILKAFCEVEGITEQEIVGLLNWHFKRVWQASEMLSQGRNAAEIGKEVRVPRFFLNDFLRHVKKFTVAKLRTVYQDLFTLDRQMKTGQIEPLAGLEAFIIRWI
ncbi:MAG: DNA polymerase III subunit delta [Candidatus Omnitrophica bacterium]|nr:DNA polymerase III subunit delta [Candidatus Omnitrophota bacterium]